MILCDSPQSTQDAVVTLKRASYLFISCEGHDLGREFGALSIVVIGSPGAKDVFIFDVSTLTTLAAVKPLTELLCRTRIPKFFWDGRTDAIEFRRTFGMTAGRALDLQLVDIGSRKMRGDKNGRKYISRMWCPLRLVRHLDLTGVHFLTALKKAPQVHGIPGQIPGKLSVRLVYWKL